MDHYISILEHLVKAIEALVWPSIFILVFISLKKSVIRFVEVFTNKFEQTGSIKMNGIEWNFDELGKVILMHEKLRAAVMTATADDQVDESEILYLKDKVASAESFATRLDKGKKEELLESYIKAASTNGKFKDAQYKLIHKVFVKQKLLQLTSEELEKQIMYECRSREAALPSQIDQSNLS